jgi:hypothetical protein
MRTTAAFQWASAFILVLAVVCLAVPEPAAAQLQNATAEVARVTGRTEVLRRNQAVWVPGSQGMRLAEGDQIRAFAGASADLNLPDGSTILVAENTRFAVTKIQYDAQTRQRQAAFHVVAGKVAARVNKAAVQLVRTRESNFTISSPAGVAAVRGTVTTVFYDPGTQQAVVFVLPSPGEPASLASVSYFSFATNTQVTVTGNQYITQTGTQPPSNPVPISTLPAGQQGQVTTAVNNATANSPALTATTVTLVTSAQIQQVLTTLGIQTPTGPPPSTPTTVITPTGTTTTSTIGRDQQVCASEPCPP